MRPISFPLLPLFFNSSLLAKSEFKGEVKTEVKTEVETEVENECYTHFLDIVIFWIVQIAMLR